MYVQMKETQLEVRRVLDVKKCLNNRELSSSLLALLFEFNTSVQSEQALVLKQLWTGFTGKFYWKEIKFAVSLEKQYFKMVAFLKAR